MPDSDTIEPVPEQYGDSLPIQKWTPGEEYELLGSVQLENAIYNPEDDAFIVNLTRSAFDSGDGLGQQFIFPASGDYSSGDVDVTVDTSKMSPRGRESNFEAALYDLLDALDGVETTDEDT